MSGPPSDQDPLRHLALSMAQRGCDQGQQDGALPHPCSRGPPASPSRDPLPVRSPAFQAGPRGPKAAFLALSLCWLGRDFLLENSRILPTRSRAWPGNLGGREVRDAPTNRVWSCGSRGFPGTLTPALPHPQVRCTKPLVLQLRCPAVAPLLELGLCHWGCHSGG